MRLIDEADVVKAIDNHTQPDGTLDDDISCILEEVPTAFDKEKVLSEINEEYVDAISLYNMHKGTAYAYSAEVRKDTWEKAKRIVEKGGIK